jgi:hypothetical protein
MSVEFALLEYSTHAAKNNSVYCARGNKLLAYVQFTKKIRQILCFLSVYCTEISNNLLAHCTPKL